ncbi:MAG: hypothetical protein QOE36_2098 [Gaiellaceae bacterium]|jgi:hypothetical protein|nr:hypothetical protein [Gaiellaceae bacterium]
MTNDLALERLRAANPARTGAQENEALFEAIVSTPGDPRLLDAPRRAVRRRWQLAAVAASALIIGVAAAWAAGTDVRQIFDSNPAGGGSPGHPPTGLWHQVAIPSTIHRAGMLSIPHFGRLELWFAETKQHGWCSAIRLPDGNWAGTKGTSGGTAPGCYPSRTTVNEASGTPVFVISGIDYYEIEVDARHDGGSFWRVVYGVTELPEDPARVVDTVSGRDAEVLSGRFFALAIADEHPDRPSPTPLWHLVAYDAGGNVIADAAKPLPKP